jgi:UDP-N-acetylmuramoyl-L-alanyl-D-glutamate--2,6-diaminopimelate ligase
MRLDLLLSAADLVGAGVPVLELQGDPGVADISAIVLDSRAVVPGALFCCVPGQRVDGHRFAPEAVASGAVALLCERPLDLPVPQVVVTTVRPALGPLADAFHGHPSRRLLAVGVTGTNGKTTTTQLLAAIFEAQGWSTATIGTLTGTRTTPEAPQLQALLADLCDRGVAAVAMEVSSHALAQDRVASVHFAAATFTNLTQDHLDYHHTMEEYFAAKARLFEPGRADVAVVNADDVWGRRLLDTLAGQPRPGVPFSVKDDVADLRLSAGGSRFRWDGMDISLRLGGRFNVYNALAAATTARELGVPGVAIAEGLAAVEVVPGRFQPVAAGQPFTVLIDYAHTPDGLEQALTSARELAAGKLLVVFGAGGDRDHAKRPLMGAVAGRLADLAVLTSDNPRTEDPNQIITDVKAGASGPGRLVVEPDRARAIAAALASAQAGDVVVIAGKGHETGQEIAGQVIPFDDAVVARRALDRLIAHRPGIDRS